MSTSCPNENMLYGPVVRAPGCSHGSTGRTARRDEQSELSCPERRQSMVLGGVRGIRGNPPRAGHSERVGAGRWRLREAFCLCPWRFRDPWCLAFGLDSTLHQDPRYFRSLDTGFWRRAAHAFRGTILTRTDSGRETLSMWRLGSDYGAAFPSNEWYPARLNTVGLGAAQGTLDLGFAFVSNLGPEFWPDVKRKMLRRRP